MQPLKDIILSDKILFKKPGVLKRLGKSLGAFLRRDIKPTKLVSWATSFPLSQKYQGSCFPTAACNVLNSAPQAKSFDDAFREKLYQDAKLADRDPDNSDVAGTYPDIVLAILKNEAIISKKIFLPEVNSMLNYLYTFGPFIFSLPWYDGMNYPANFIIKILGVEVGHHAIEIYGYDPIEKMFLAMNNWGVNEKWAAVGQKCKIPLAQMKKLSNRGAYGYGVVKR